MRLGIVGMLPGDFRTIQTEHLEAISELGFTGAGFHFPGNLAHEIKPADIERCRSLFDRHGLELVQFAVTYRECLFDPDPAIRQAVVDTIAAAARIASQLSAQFFLIRPGSLNPAGSWTPHRDNHTDEAWELMIGTLKAIAPALRDHSVTAVVETHLVSILRDPETCKRAVAEVGSPNVRLVMDYVNHFESLRQVYDSTERLDHIFSEIGAISPVMHIKDISLGPGLVVHIEEAVPGEGELDLAHCFRHFEALYPKGYGLIEHLKPNLIPEAARRTREIASRAGITVR